jgi:hypothetical protein
MTNDRMTNVECLGFIRHSEIRHSSFIKYLAEESNPVVQIRSLPCSSITLARRTELSARSC